MAQPVGRYLARFGVGGVEDVFSPPDAPPFKATLEPEPVVSVETLMAAARADGFAEGQAAAKAAEDGRLVQERQRFSEKLAAARETWVAEGAEHLAALIAQSMTDLETRVAESAGAVLRPFLEASLRQQAVTALVTAVATLTRDQDCPALRISGPVDLVTALGARLDARLGVELCPDDTLRDVSIVAGQTVIESRLAAWAERLDGATEHARGG